MKILSCPGKQNHVSFKNIYVDEDVRIGYFAKSETPPVFTETDSLILNEIAMQYPNQDCFIRSGKDRLPRLEFREKPKQIPSLKVYGQRYATQAIDREDPNNACVQLLVYPNSIYSGLFSTTSSFSFIPSLPHTVKTGFELHKKYLEKKYMILDSIGKTGRIDFGKEKLLDRVYEETESTEVSFHRYLVENAALALFNRDKSKQRFDAVYPKMEAKLEEKEKKDMLSKDSDRSSDETGINYLDSKDLCTEIEQEYPNRYDNEKMTQAILKRLKQLKFVD